eukprot:CAMPEP_0119548968 /NCGR_PEP_ID=MMETSP1352-20130426/2766_1 /TAXON_ID=265584 /ORGANISM="Stauroneis constricta, Strain CCMP1120" /LENGTH=725 /DNA_ID=CAMNT_0007594385 /DNA_START=340 /DNA_END=2517 /DNA_ORIENTATION=-
MTTDSYADPEATAGQYDDDDDAEYPVGGGLLVNDGEEDYDDGSNQLPSVEEYKANMVQGMSIRAGDDSRIAPMEIGDDGGDDGNQLPSVEEYKTGAASGGAGAGGTSIKSSENTRGRNRIMILLLAIVFLCAAIIPLAILLPKKDSGSNNSTNGSRGSGNGSGNGSDDGGTVQQPEPIRTEPLPFDEVVEHLLQYQASSSVDLSNPQSPQYRAAKWIAEEDTLEIEMDGDAQHSFFIERYALAVLYYATGGETWKWQMNFLKPTSVCNWNQQFLTTSLQIVRLGVFSCLNGGGVSRFGLPQNNLTGTIPDEIRHLDDVDAFILQWNRNLKGPIPAGLTEMSGLEVLDISYCSLSSSLPDSLEDLTKLTSLGLSNNLMTGTIPFEALPNLVELRLDDNGFDGDVNEFNGMMPNLKFLYLEDNGFTGTLNENLISYWAKTVQNLDLSDNMLDGPLPTNLFDPTSKMNVIDLHGNRLVGEIPTMQQENTKLQFLALHENFIKGFIPASIDKLVNLLHLDIARNELVGTIPDTMKNLSKLRYLHTSDNEFTEGDMPEFVSSLTKLRELSMKKNNLKGSIPTWIGNLTSLQLLDLDSNDFSGPIPSEIGKLRGLDHLLLNRNELTGELPNEMNLLRDLDVALFDHNLLNGTFDFFCNKQQFPGITTLAADAGGTEPLVACQCCTIKCDPTDPDCNQLEYFVNFDPIWEYGYQRNVYDYSEEIVPVEDRED